MGRAGIVALCLGASLASASAAETLPSVSRGIGGKTCGEFAANYAKDTGTEIIWFTWAQGFMSATNYATLNFRKNIRDLSGDIEIQQRQIRQYCDAHPLAEYGSAVLDLYLSLPLVPIPKMP
jgi:hypothetical protein